MIVSPTTALSKKDFESDQEVRWCPGCGDYSILATVQRLLPELDVPKENHVFVSGIGCAARFPYYMNTYGFHTIHGRAPAIASGLKIANPDLTVWIISGDGDALSIGGNHFMHLMRRNVNVNFLLFNNRIYGLTKGQYSPTSEVGKVTKSTPMGSIDTPVNPLSLALAAGASFVARSLEVDAKLLTDVLRRAVDHKGTSFIEIFQNCNVFNDGAHAQIGERQFRKSRQLQLEHEAPMVFGDDNEHALALDGLHLKQITKNDCGFPDEPLRHDQTNLQLAHLLATCQYPEHPVPMGVVYEVDRPCYDESIHEQVTQAREKRSGASLKSLLYSGDTWEVK